jgi:hypothetical protein
MAMKRATMMKLRRFGLLLDLIFLASSLATSGPVAAQLRVIAVLVAAMVGAVVVFCAVLFAIGILAQREPPYPI